MSKHFLLLPRPLRLIRHLVFKELLPFMHAPVRVCAVIAVLALCAPALARDNGQYNSVSPETRAWFRAQKSPKTGALCCNEADGIYAEEDIREGQYWARWPGHDWQEVPEEVVIRSGNPHGAPVVWWYVERGETKIRCYAPGGGV